MRVQARIAAIVALCAIWLAMLAFGAGPLDRQIYEALYAGHRPMLLTAARIITFFGEPGILISTGLLAAAVLIWQKRMHLAFATLLVVIIGRSLSELQKYWIGRPRPNLEPHLVVVGNPSFPSGHAASSMIFCLTIALALTAETRWQRPAVAIAVVISFLIGSSRVILGVHWPSDVVAGWAFGMLWVLLTLRPIQRRLNA